MQPFTLMSRPVKSVTGPATIASPLDGIMREPFDDTSSSAKPPEDRLNSWKEIAAYFNRDVTTVQRWEKREGMPVHRHLHDKIGSIYAFRLELDAWASSRNLNEGQQSASSAASPDPVPQPSYRRNSFIARTLVLAAVAVQFCGFGSRTTSGATPSRVLDSRRSRISTESRGTRHSRVTVISWLSCRTTMGKWMCGLVRSAQGSFII
jgi:hypothetical protein